MTLSQACKDAGLSFVSFETSAWDAVLVFGTCVWRDAPALLQALKDAALPTRALLTIEDSRTEAFYRYEVGAEEGVLAVLCEALGAHKDPTLATFFEHLDTGYLSAECNLGEEEATELASWLQDRRVLCVLGADLEHHPKATELASWLALLAHLGNVSFMMAGKAPVDAQSNSLVLPDIPEELESFDGTIVYACPHESDEEGATLIGSQQFSVAAKIKEGQRVEIESPFGAQRRVFCLDEAMKGTVALLPFAHAPEQFRYAKATIKQVG